MKLYLIYPKHSLKGVFLYAFLMCLPFLLKAQNYERLYMNGDNWTYTLTSANPTQWGEYNANNMALSVTFPGRITSPVTRAGGLVVGSIKVKGSGGGTATFSVTLRKNGTVIGSASGSITANNVYQYIHYEFLPSETITSSDDISVQIYSAASVGQGRSIDLYMYYPTCCYIDFPLPPVTPSAPILSLPANHATNQLAGVNLMWSSVDGADLYKLQVSTDPSFSNLIVNDSSVTIPGYATAGIVPNTIYYWRVRAKNTGGISSWSETWDFTTLALPDVPTLASPANGATNQSLTPSMSWNAASGATSYNLQVSTSSGFGSTVINQSGISSTSYAASGLSNNTTYYWRVSATNAGGNSGWSSVYSFTTLPGIPSAPVLTTPANGATNQSLTPSMSWNAASGATSYNLQVSTSSGFGSTVINQSGITSTSYAASGLSNNTTYYWRVSATNAGGTSEWSSVYSFTTLPGIPSAPVLTTPANGATNQSLTPSMSWNAASGATSYNLQVSTSSGFGSTVINQSGITSTSYAASGLSNNTTYYWRVSATNSSGTSEWSTACLFTTVPPLPDVPVIASPVSGAINQPLNIFLSWNAANGATSYRVAVSESMDFSSTIFEQSGITTTTIQVTGLSNNTTYYWIVRSENAGGYSQWPTTMHFTTIPDVPSAPLLSAPLDGSINQPVINTLSWTNVSGATSYHLQVSTSTGFETMIVNQAGLPANDMSVTGLSYNTTYYWRVRATNAGGNSSWSPVFNFSTMEALLTPQLSSPANNSINQPLVMNLYWLTTQGASSYRIQISTTSDFATTVFDQPGLTTTNYTASGLEGNTTYYWRINETGGNGTSDWSETWQFTTMVVTSAEPSETNEFRIYPNPVSAYLRVYSSGNQEYQLSIFNTGGMLIFNQILSGFENSLDVSNLVPGIYFVKMVSGTNVSMMKMKKE